MSISSEIQKMVQSASSSSTHRATVLRTDNDGTTWVSIPGGADETFLHGSLVEYQPGDEIEVTIEGGRAHATGNATEPSAGLRSIGVAVAPVREMAEGAAKASATAEKLAAEAAEVANATSQHFWDDGNGAHVTDVTRDEWDAAVYTDFPDYDPETKPYHNQLLNSLGILLRTALNNLVSITRSAIAFFDGNGNEAENIVARFGSDGFQVGLNSDTHLIGDYHSLQLVDKEGDTYFHVSDLRGADGYATVTEHFTADGTRRGYYTQFDVRSAETTTATVDGASAAIDYVSAPPAIGYVRLVSTPAEGAAVEITYQTASGLVKAYTLGRRASGTGIGAYSVAAGYDVEASGNKSHAEGSNTTANDTCSHAEGYQTTASGFCSHSEGHQTTADGDYSHAEGEGTTASDFCGHAEGKNTTASGWYSHAQNQGTIAASANQTAMGKYNVEDDNGDYALIIGNGSSDSNRSNAFTVDWEGNGAFAGDVSMENYQTHDNAHSFASPTASGNVYGNSWDCYDSRGTKVGYAQTANTPSSVCRSFVVTNPRSGSAGNVGIYLYSNDNGTMDANLTAGCTWRVDDIPNLPASKITSETLPIARGGTGTSAPVSETSGVITVNSDNATLVSQAYASWGKVAMLNVCVKLKTALSTGTTGNIGNVTLGTVANGKRPVTNTDLLIPEYGGVVNLNPAGALVLTCANPNQTIATTAELWVRGTYILA